MGRHDRRDAGRGAGDLGGARLSWVLHRHRLLRPWLRHRPRRRTTDGGPRDWRYADRRSLVVPLVALHRRLAATSPPGTVGRPRKPRANRALPFGNPTSPAGRTTLPTAPPGQ